MSSQHTLWLRLLALGAAVFACAVHAQQMTLEVITLQHRLVRDVLPVVAPLVAPGGTITGTDNQLILRTTPENLAEIQQVLAALDTRLKQLRITVAQDRFASSMAEDEALSGHVRSGDFAAGVADPGAPGGANLSYRGADGNVHYRTSSTQAEDDSRNTHFVLTMEGQPAFIATGQDVPYVYHNATVAPFGAVVSEGIAYQNVSSGVYVTPRVLGETVTLEIAPRLERLDPNASGAIQTQSATTIVSGRLGEWIRVGGASESLAGGDAGLLARTRRQNDSSYSVWVKVEKQR